uniref:IS110 family transposase n=1 Tax=Mesocestoides corti TaxID=53468 RepID=A0A5K3EZH9_MESCO
GYREEKVRALREAGTTVIPEHKSSEFNRLFKPTVSCSVNSRLTWLASHGETALNRLVYQRIRRTIVTSDNHALLETSK